MQPESREAAHRPWRQTGEWISVPRVLALCLAATIGTAAGQIEKGQIENIYRGGTPKWYDSFDTRLNNDFLTDNGDTGIPFCAAKKLKGFGKEYCVVNHGCCWIPPQTEGGVQKQETEQCVACQEIRGTWQGVLGTCVYKDIEVSAEFNLETNLPSKPVKTTRCIPTVVDPSVIIFRETGGKMATGVSPSSGANNGGRFAFDFQYSRNEGTGEIDVMVATFLGTRIVFGKYEVQESELGSTLYLALGVTRSKTARPKQTSAELPEEMVYVFFEGFRIDEFTPAADTYPARRLPAGSCKHVVTPGEDMDSISRRYMLTWQEIYAFNSHVYEPEDLKPGDLLSVGRHHEVKGPCVNYQFRQNGPNQETDIKVDYTCECTSKIECRAADGFMKGETLFGIATRYGTSWQRIVDMNPKLFQGCDENTCVITPGDHLCVVPYLRNVMCETEYRRFPVLDNNGNSPGYLQTFFSCSPKWSSKLTVDKCCQFPRCKCCTSDSYAGIGKTYESWNSAPQANKCDVTALPHAKCLQDPLITKDDGSQIYSLLCDDDCQYLCDSTDPTVPDPNCPSQVGLVTYTGFCREKRMLNGDLKKICT